MIACALCERSFLRRPQLRAHMRVHATDVLGRFWSCVDQGIGPASCWIWTGALSDGGYGLISIADHTVLVHRLSVELASALPIPDGLTVDHLCRMRACVNPAHLEVVPMRVNLLRGIGPSAVNAAKTHCPRGHEYTAENTGVGHRGSGGNRYCRTCHREREANRRKEKAQA